jgi:predicted SnoaL-like aldol condensation-catalyzing enzyme
MSHQVHTNTISARRIVGVFLSGDVSEVDALIDPTYHDHQGLAGVALHGQAGFRQVVASARAALPNLHVTIDDLIAEGDKVVMRLRWRSRITTSTTIERETIEILRFADGRAVEHWGAEAWAREYRPDDRAEEE